MRPVYVRFALVLFAVLLIILAGISVSRAASVGPSIEVVGGPAAGNYCNGGMAVTVPVQRYFPGAPSQFGNYYMTVAGQQVAGMPQASFSYDGQTMFGSSTLTLNLLQNLNLAAGTTMIFAVSTYMEDLDTWVYYSWVHFNCSTGAVVKFENTGIGEPYVQQRPTQTPVLLAQPTQTLPRPVSGRP